MKLNVILASVMATSAFSGLAMADDPGNYDRAAYELGRSFSGEDFGGTQVSGYVVDLYVELEESNILLNIYNFNDVGLGNTYFQGLTAAGWAPNEQGSIFTTEVSQSFDSFIAIGGVTGEDGVEKGKHNYKTGPEK